MGVGLQPGPGGGQVLDHVDADGRPAEAGLDDVGPSNGGGGSRRRRAAPGAGWGARRRPPPRRRPACPCRARPRPRSGPEYADAGQVEGRLERAVLARAPVAAHQRRRRPSRVRAVPSRPPGLGEPAAGAGRELQAAWRPGAHPPRRPRPRGRGRPRTTHRSWTRRGPGRSGVAGAGGQAAGGLQPGQHADVVLGRRTSEDDGYVGHGGLAPPIGIEGPGPASGPSPADALSLSRVVVRQIVLVQHDVAGPEVAARPTPPPAWRSADQCGLDRVGRRPGHGHPAGQGPAVGPAHDDQVGRPPRRWPPRTRRFSATWRGPSSTMPGVTTARWGRDRCGAAARRGPPARGPRGLRPRRPDWRCRCRRGWSTPAPDLTAWRRWSTEGRSPSA